MINAGIFAAGKGERFKKDFPDTPKPLIKINNKTLIEYAIENLLILKPSFITILLNTRTGPMVIEYLKKKGYDFKYILIDSKTSFESFYTLSNFLKEKGKTVLLSTVDSILNPQELLKMAREHMENSAYITLGITSNINDEKPLLVEIDEENKRITSIGKKGDFATNGIYSLSYNAISDIKPSMFKALREFLSSIDFKNKRVNYHIINESLDIDDISDIEIAINKLNNFKRF